ncbi:hypothetical protein [Xiamenia xianingshaonis]|uniref:Uncharacterized protein n=1 Tax=Xiamenia xianingshaonis TaxID=2682776 RepID=A0A9E6MRN7_9ACTN|nr:hypothetical protein [Xiamenia xianingshaonis]NHM14456.1 hypothetical protein [Xiamenia xianingshaonis]QTU84930.1 hypothetical protein J7S26_03195 [Xiamenia xianingshaonis]
MDERFLFEDGADLQTQLQDALVSAYSCINEMVPLKERVCALTRDYKVRRAELTVAEREERKTPVSMIDAVVRGNPELADIEYELSLADAAFDANYEAILFHKKRADSIRDQIGREWADVRNAM